MGQRLVRAKQKIRMAGIAYEVPEARGAGAAAQRPCSRVIYLVFTEGYVVRDLPAKTLMRPLTFAPRGPSGLRPSARCLDAGAQRDQGAVGADAAARRPPRRAGKPRAAISCCSKSRTVRYGDFRQIGEGLKLVEEALRMPGPAAGPTRCRPRSRALSCAGGELS